MIRLRNSYGPASLAFAFACALLLPAAVRADDKPVNVAGTWTWTMKRMDQEITQTLKLKQDGDKITGTIEGPQGGEVAIEDAKLDGANFSFQVVREFNGNKFTIKYKGKVEGEKITGKSSRERDGETIERDWEAKKAPVKKA